MLSISKKVLTFAVTAVMSVTTMTASVFADEPYDSYNYDTWEEAIPSQSGYRVDKTVTGEEMNLERLRDPDDELYVDTDELPEDEEMAAVELDDARDLFCDTDYEEFWVADTNNNRLLRLNKDLEVIGRYYGVLGDTEIAVDEETGLSRFASPYGLYVTTSEITGKHIIYIADYDNSRVVKAEIVSNTELELIQEYTKPEEALYESETFIPTKVVADRAENVYVVVKSVNKGAVLFDSDGGFTGYYGANRVEVTAKVIAQQLWRKIASNEQIAGMERNVPVEYANFDIDDDGFIYTVTEVSTSTDAVKKLNYEGYNIWDNSVGDEYQFGDITDAVYDPVQNTNHQTRLTDIAIGDNGVMNVLDYETGRVFQYDRNANLICIFGTKNSTSDQRGSFLNPNAVDCLGENVYVIDGSKNDITVFTETAFGSYLHEAYELYDEGKYTEAAPYWEQVIKRDGNYTTAYIGLGKAALKNEEYTKALDYFETAYDQDDYDSAFKYAREDWLRENFTVILIILGVLIALLIVRHVLKKKGIKLIKKKTKAKEGE